MDMKWEPPDDAQSSSFDNEASPYLHYWQSSLPASGDPRRAAVELATRLHVGTDEMIKRAFGAP